MSDFKWNVVKQTYEITDEGIIAKAKQKLDELDVSSVVIDSDETYQKVWQKRTEINTLVKDLSTKRKQMEAVALSRFKPQCLEVEKHGAKISDELTKNLNAYKPKEKKAPTSFTITIKANDLRVIKKVENVALKYGCQVITKEE